MIERNEIAQNIGYKVLRMKSALKLFLLYQSEYS